MSLRQNKKNILNLISFLKERFIYFHQNHGQKWFYLSLVFFIAFITRFYRLDLIPTGLYSDEASIGYNAYCISELGKDEHGESFPIYFKAFGEYKNPLLVYIEAIFIKLFGPSVGVIRFGVSVLGFLSIVFTYLLARLYFDKKTSLLSAFLLSISPWHMLFSRQVGDASSYTMFLVLGLYLFLRGVKHDSKCILFSSIPIGLSFYSYAIAKLFTPLIFLFVVLINLKLLKHKIKYFITWILAVFLIITPMIFATITINGIQGRYNLLSITNKYFCIDPAKKELKKTPLSFLAISDITVLPAVFVSNYFKHMSFDFLLLHGDRNGRHNIGERGQLLFFTFWMSLIGFFNLLFRRKSELLLFPLWFLLFPVPPALTWEALPHAARSICGLPVFEILAAVGFFTVISFIQYVFSIKKMILASSLSLVFVLFLIRSYIDANSAVYGFFVNYAKNSALWYDYGACAISQATRAFKDYDRIYIPIPCNEVNFLFLQKINPEKWINKKEKLNYVYYENRDEKIVNYNQRVLKVSLIDESEDESKIIGYVYNEPTNSKWLSIKNIPSLQESLVSKPSPKNTKGVLGTYYNGLNFNSLVLSREESKIDFDFGWKSPDAKVHGDDFSAIWSGYLKINTPGDYKFILTSDNGSKLYIDGKLLIDDWQDHAIATHEVKVPLKKGIHSIIVKFVEYKGTALIKLEWVRPDGKREVIGSDVLSPPVINKD